jgi:pilus assembly protein FimV
LNKYTNYIASMALLFPVNAFSVTLGSLTVKSYLNQPLNAYIRLTDLGGTPVSGIKVRLAGPEAFKRAGIDRSYNLSKLSFKVVKLRGKPIVKVTSSERIDEPFVTFLVDLTWAKGQYYRTYTMLLDPPGYNVMLNTHKKPPAKKKKKRDSWYSVGSKSKDISSTVIRSPMPVNDKKIIASQYGPVKAKDDLWKIAIRYKPENLTVYQVMIAILAFNPNAFSSENINGLRVGVVLDIPNYKVMASVPKDKAKLEVEAQSLAWKTKKTVSHKLSNQYLKRDHYEKSPLKITPKTSYLPPLKIKTPKQALPVESAINTIKTPPNKEKELMSSETIKTDPAISFIPPIKSNEKLKNVNESEPLQVKKENVFDDFIPIPQVLTKIIKEPHGNKDTLKKKASIQTKLETPLVVKEQKATPKIAPELAVAASAIATVKESNLLLRDQVKNLIKQNELLKIEALAEKRAVNDLKKKFDSLSRLLAKHYKLDEKGEFVKRESVQSGASIEEEASAWYWIILSIFAVLILAAGGVFGLLYLKQQGLFLKRRQKDSRDNIDDLEDLDKKEVPSEEMTKSAPLSSPVDDEALKRPTDNRANEKEPTQVDSNIGKSSPKPIDKVKAKSDAEASSTAVTLNNPTSEKTPFIIEKTDDNQDEEDEGVPDNDSSYVLEFEPGLAPKEDTSHEEKKVESETAPPPKVEDGFVFELEPQVVPGKINDDESSSDKMANTELPTDDTASKIQKVEKDDNPTLAQTSRVKASTQLALAETYIAMEDVESAKLALKDVIETGNEKQVKRAKELMTRLES